MAFILENWSSIVGIAGAAHLLALAICVTPTPKDDELYGKFYKVIEMIAGIVTKVAKNDRNPSSHGHREQSLRLANDL